MEEREQEYEIHVQKLLQNGCTNIIFFIFFGIVAKWLCFVLTCLIVVVAVIYLF